MCLVGTQERQFHQCQYRPMRVRDNRMRQHHPNCWICLWTLRNGSQAFQFTRSLKVSKLLILKCSVRVIHSCNTRGWVRNHRCNTTRSAWWSETSPQRTFLRTSTRCAQWTRNKKAAITRLLNFYRWKIKKSSPFLNLTSWIHKLGSHSSHPICRKIK